MLRLLRLTSFRRGVMGGSRAWTIVATVLFGVRLLKKIAGSEPEVVHTSRLRPGESLVIRHDLPKRSARRARP